MAKPYSMDLRERAMRRVAAGESAHSVAAVLKVSVSSIIKWAQRQRRTGSVAPGKMGGHRSLRVSGEHRTWRWILTRSATRWDARAHQGKIGFSFPLRRLPLHFEMRRRLRGNENRVGTKRWGVALRVGIQGLLARVAGDPNVTLRSLARELGERGITVCHGTVGRFLHREGQSFKKTVLPAEQLRLKLARHRARWKAHQGKVDQSRLVFIDETWIKPNLAPLGGWGTR